MSGIKKPSRLPQTKLPTIAAARRPLMDVNNGRLKRNASPSPPGVIPLKKVAYLRRSKSVMDLRAKSSVVSPPNRPAFSRAASRPNLREQDISKPIIQPLVRSRTILSTARKPVNNGPPPTTLARTGRAILSTAKKQVPPTAAKSAAVRPTTTNTKTAAGGGLKRKLAPYDYKGRFQELSERYDALKAKNLSMSEDLERLQDIAEMYEDVKQKLDILHPEVQTLRSQNMELNEDKNMLEMKMERISTALDKITAQHEETKSEVDFLRSETSCLKEENDTVKSKLAKVVEEGEFFKNEFFRIEMERKRLHNHIMDLKGNIRVFCRIRPPLATETEKTLMQWNMHDETSFEMAGYDSIKKKMMKHDFAFDMVFHQKTTQEDVYENVSPLIQSALDGYNICIFAYGQTGSGKSYTMDGTREHLGIIPRTVDLLFDSINHLNRCGWSYTVQASFLEIYNEMLCDLLDPKPKQMDIKMVSTTNAKDVYVSNIKEVDVKTARELRQLMDTAKTNRITACTAGNERSSRSHAVTNITVIGKHRDRKWERSKGTINLVDLAGSESPKVSTRMEETKNINRSLSELTNVMLALVKKSNHVPYRNSKLTHLLMPSLGGNSKTLMIVNVNPLEDSFQETSKSLRFAATVNSCTMAKAKRVKIFDHQDSGCRSDEHQ